MYFASGKQILRLVADAPAIGIADVIDNETASAMAAAFNLSLAPPEQPVGSFSFIDEALVTLSPAFHGELVAYDLFRQRLDVAIEALEQLDEVKKSLFYGRDNKIAPTLGYLGTAHVPHLMATASHDELTMREATDFIHGAIGYATEAGEMLEALRSAIDGEPVDGVNVMEEAGDGKWYLAILARVFGYAWGAEERRVIAKLRKRFPDNFTEFDANNRNLAAERVVLEGNGQLNEGRLDPVVDNSADSYMRPDETSQEYARRISLPRDIAEQSLPVHHRTRRMEGERNQDGNALEAQKPGN